MSAIYAGLQHAVFTPSQLTTYAGHVLANGQIVFEENSSGQRTGRYKLGDGTATLSTLPWLGGSGSASSVETVAYVLANQTLVLPDKQILYLRDGRYAIGDGTTQLSAIPFYTPSGQSYIVSTLSETTAFMNAIGIANNSTIYYSGTAEQITGAEMWTAVNNLFGGLKNNGLWSNGKGRALYPVIGGSSNTHKFNAFDPVDTDAGFRLTYTGTVTHDKYGMSFNSSYANTKLIPVADGLDLSTGMSIAFSSRTNTTNPEYVLGSYPKAYYATDAGGVYVALGNTYSVSSPAPNIQGRHIINRTASNNATVRYLKNGTLHQTYSKSFIDFGTTEILLGAINDMTTLYYSAANLNLEFVGIFDGLTTAEETVLDGLMSTFKIDMKR